MKSANVVVVKLEREVRASERRESKLARQTSRDLRPASGAKTLLPARVYEVLFPRTPSSPKHQKDQSQPRPKPAH